MKRLLLFFCFCAFGKWVAAQKVDSIYFHLYTDSLKKGFYNYINVDGKTNDGRWLPLTSNDLNFSATDNSSLRFQGNDLFIDSAYKKDFVTVKAVLKKDPAIWKEVIIYIRKRGFDEPLKTNDEILGEFGKQSRKNRNNHR